MIRLSPFTRRVLLENSSSLQEHSYIMSVKENQAVQYDSILISKLYKATMSRSVDYGSIRDSAGDITKFEGYNSMKESLGIVTDLAKQARVDIQELKTVEDAILNLEKHRDLFVKGYVGDRGIVVIVYNSIVLATLDAISHILSSYVGFVRTPTIEKFEIKKRPDSRFSPSIESLREFNRVSDSGDLHRILLEGTKSRSQFMGDAIVVTAITVGALSSIVPLIREIVYYFYYNRLVVGDYLSHQSALINHNSTQLMANNNMTEKERQKIVKRQKKYGDVLHKMSEKIAISTNEADKKRSVDIKKEDKSWTISDIESEASSMDPSGFSLI